MPENAARARAAALERREPLCYRQKLLIETRLGGAGGRGIAPSTAARNALPDPVETDLGPVLPAFLAVPQLNALDNAALAGQIDRAGGPAGRDAIAN